GTILPYDFSGERDLGGTLGVRSVFGGEILTQFGSRRYFVSADDARLWPAPLDEQNSKIVAASLLGQKYGWGGYKFLRDCSLMTKDFLANFGLWLPRNSKAQSGRGERFSLIGMSADEKLSFIGKNGVAYKTLLYMPGHVMLYVGQVDGKPAVLHDIWGLRTMDGRRAVIGRTAITSLTIGSDRADIAEDRLLISRVSGMSVLSGEEDFISDDRFAPEDPSALSAYASGN
ncbi:MAG: NlpC/P60 family protein, partial [Campylobacter sp.]